MPRLRLVLTAAMGTWVLAGAARTAGPEAPVAAVKTAAAAQTLATLARIEAAYADFNDADGAVSLIDSDPGRYLQNGWAGRRREVWQKIYTEKRVDLIEALGQPPAPGLPATDARAIEVMRAAISESPAAPESLAPVGRCRDAQRPGLGLAPLHRALYACFAELANSLSFENGTVTRVAAFDLLTRLEEPARRKALFMAFRPLWRALNGRDEAGSPYRRLIRLTAAEPGQQGSPIDAAGRTIGVAAEEIERWLERILQTWSEVSGDAVLEPWDYRFEAGAAERELGEAIPREALLPLNERYYLDLGLDVVKAGVIYDLEPRTGKAPLAYSEYVRRGRTLDGGWQPTLTRVSASYARGGLGELIELVHENGHVVHMLALHTRPAFMDLGDPLFYEAFADVPAWSVYEPAWQRKYLGRSAAESVSLRALYSAVMLDVAWALFDLRMLREPTADPNAAWTAITSRYLHVKPHPELAWWAVRVQLVDKPGYMVNYGLGAVITADIRRRIAGELGPFEAGDARWYGWLAAHLLETGEEHESAELLRRFLGRAVSPDALIGQLHRVAPVAAATASRPPTQGSAK